MMEPNFSMWGTNGLNYILCVIIFLSSLLDDVSSSINSMGNITFKIACQTNSVQIKTDWWKSQIFSCFELKQDLLGCLY